MEKKIVLITGGASGIGFGAVEYLLKQDNYEIIYISKTNKNISLAKEKLGDNADKVLFLQGDIRKEEDCKRLYNEIDARYSKLDGLVNASGIIKFNFTASTCS